MSQPEVEETTTEAERVAATAALGEAENERAPSQAEVDLLLGVVPTPPPTE